MSLPSRLLGANPSIQVSTLLSGSLSTPSAKGTFALNQYSQIETQTVSGSSSITFSNIPQTYEHLQVRYFAKDNRSPVYSGVGIRYNNDTSANYWYYYPDVSTTVGSFGIYTDYAATYIVSGNIPGGSSSTYYGAGWVTIFNYRNTDMWKYQGGVGGYTAYGDGSYQGFVTQSAGMWRNNAAITSITFFSNTNSNFQTGTRISLYGIKGS